MHAKRFSAPKLGMRKTATLSTVCLRTTLPHLAWQQRRSDCTLLLLATCRTSGEHSLGTQNCTRTNIACAAHNTIPPPSDGTATQQHKLLLVQSHERPLYCSDVVLGPCPLVLQAAQAKAAPTSDKSRRAPQLGTVRHCTTLPLCCHFRRPAGCCQQVVCVVSAVCGVPPR